MKKEPQPTVERYSKALRQKADELRRSVSAQTAAQIVRRADRPSDEGDMSQQSHEEWIFVNRNNLDARLLREVELAIARIDHGGYGVCQECDEPISVKRLQAVPWARFCVTCQEMLGSLAGENTAVSKN